MIRGLDYFINLHDKSFTRNMSRAQSMTATLDNKFAMLGRTIGTAFGAWQAAAFIKSSTETFAQLEALDVRLKTVHSSASGYEQAQRSINKIITDLKLPLMETTDGYTRLAAATQGTNLEGQRTIDIFNGMAVAGRALKLDSEMGRIMKAIEQMISKGTVSAEELRGQLGDALPGAVRLGAEAMGMSQGQLLKEMEKGNIKGVEFVEKLSRKMIEVYGSKIPDALNSTQAKMTEAANAIVKKTAEIGEKAAPVYLQYLDLKLRFLNILERLMPILEKLTGLFDKHLETIIHVAEVVGLLWLRTKAITIATGLWALATGKLAPAYAAMETAAAVSLASQTTGILNWKNTALSAIGAIAKRIPIIAAAWALSSYSLEEYSDGWKTMVKNIEMRMSGFVGNILKPFNPEMSQQLLDNMKRLEVGYNGLGNRDKLNLMSREEKNAMWANSKDWNGVLVDGKVIKPRGGMKTYGASFFGNKGQFPSNSEKKNNNQDSGLDNSPISVAAGRSVRNIAVTVNNQFNVTATTIKESGIQAARILRDELNRAILDFEAAL